MVIALGQIVSISATAVIRSVINNRLLIAMYDPYLSFAMIVLHRFYRRWRTTRLERLGMHT